MAEDGTVFPQNLRLKMRERGLTVSKLCAATGVKRATLGDWLAGAKPRDLSDVKKVATYLECSFEWLLLGTSEENHVAVLNSLPRQLFFDGFVKLRIEVVVPTGGKKEET